MSWQNDKSRHSCMRRNMGVADGIRACASSDDAQKALGDKLGRILVTVLGMVADVFMVGPPD
jgi:hypothetical protein